MYNLVKAVKEILDHRVIARRNLRAVATAGTYSLAVAKAYEFTIGADIVLSDGLKAEAHIVADIPDGLTLITCQPLACGYSTDAIVQKTYGGQTPTAYIGEPPAIPSFPALTVTLVEREQEGLALQTVSDTYVLRVGVWTDKATYDVSFRTMHDLVQIVEGSLFTTIFPLIEPYRETTLIAPVSPADTTITVADTGALNHNVDFYIDDDAQSSSHRVSGAGRQPVTDGVFTLTTSANHTYAAGSRVYVPFIHVYDAGCTKITYDDPQQGSVNLMRATLFCSLKMARARRGVG